MPRVAYLVTIRALPGARDALLAVLAGLVEAARDEPGTETWVVHIVEAEPDLVITYEVFADDDAVRLHRESDAVQRALPKLAELVAESTAHRAVPVLGTGLESGRSHGPRR